MNKTLSGLILTLGVIITSQAAPTPPRSDAPMTSMVAKQKARHSGPQQITASRPQVGPTSKQNCLIDQFVYNNFLYMVSDDGKGNPKFMSMPRGTTCCRPKVRPSGPANTPN